MQSNQFSTSSASEGFKVSQLVTRTRTTSTLNRLGARLAAGEGKLAKDVRSYQDLFDRHEKFEALLFKELGQNTKKTNVEKINNLRIQIGEMESSLNDLKEKLNQDFPDYTALVKPQPLALKDVAKLLNPNDAILKFVVESEMTYVWIIRQNEWALNRIKLGEEELSRLIYELRQSLNPQLGLKPFDLKAAAYLYDVLLKPSETLLTDIENLMIVTDGPLGSLPFGLLVKGMVQESEGESSYEPNTIASRGLDGEDNQLQLVTNDPSESRNTAYRKANWLAKKYAFTTIPSVSSLNTLRGKANTVSKAPEPFLGFGDPLLPISKDDPHKSDLSDLFTSSKDDPHKSDRSSSIRGAVADVEEVRKLFYRLPETAQELQTIARTLGAPKESVFLREEATEKKVKSMDLNNARIIAFATHGLISGEMKGLAEPALVLTPPKVGSLEDDGMLTASEIAQLKLDADLVILSACNTASSDGKPGADGLSGLARSFFYAGARSLLVSHWPVESESAMKLTTGMFTELAAQPGVGRAEALKLAQLSLIQDDKNPKFAHPFYWAPFVVVGEGGVWNP
jgi:CHAT domain-containing protein